MRAVLVGMAGALVALAGFAGSASASATIDLIWAATGTNTISSVGISSNITLNIVLTAGPNGSSGGGVSVDYSALAADFSVITFTNLPAAPLPTSFGGPADTGTQIQSIQAFALPGPPPPVGLPAGGTFLMGTVTFRNDSALAGSFQVDSLLTGTDGIADGFFTDISGAVTFNSAFANVPEPGTMSLLGMGLGGLYVVGRRSSRKR